MSAIRDTKTTVTGYQGDSVTRTEHPGDLGPAGLQAGDSYVNTSIDTEFIYDGDQWWGRVFVTTTSTSTTTTSTSTTTTSTSTTTTSTSTTTS